MDISRLDTWHFEVSEGPCNALLELVLQGVKKATCSSVDEFEKEKIPLPSAGDRTVITYQYGTPGCLIETTQVTILPYKVVTFELARKEGEDDSLESWMSSHELFFKERGKELGYTFHEDRPVVFEEFRVIEVLKK